METIKKTNINKVICFTDIHFGAKSNQEQHNIDCYNYINWLISIIKFNNDIQAIIFMGDWFECRSSLNIATMNWSYKSASLLNELGLPIYFIIGNHDLYHRNTRDIHSLIHFKEFENFILIDEPTVFPEIGNGGAFLSPFLFHEEYKNLKQYLKYKTWWGHFEFKGFVVTGSTNRMMSGPDVEDFKGPKHIFSGHFHKRQTINNITYIGNTFPTNFGDVNDTDRGCMIYDHDTDNMVFHNWEDCPKYFKLSFSDMRAVKVDIPTNSYVKCIIDTETSYEEIQTLKHNFSAVFKPRDLILEESGAKEDSLTNTESEDISVEIDDITTIDDLVVKLLNNIDNEQLDNQLLIRIYSEL